MGVQKLRKGTEVISRSEIRTKNTTDHNVDSQWKSKGIKIISHNKTAQKYYKS